MKKIILLIFCMILFVGCFTNKYVKMEADGVNKFCNNIRTMYNADSVIVNIATLRGDPSIPTTYGPVIFIYNAKTKTLNFKQISEIPYQGFYETNSKITDSLWIEAYPIAQTFVKDFDISKYNNLNVEFIKLDSVGEPLCRIILWYTDLVWKKNGIHE